MMTYDAFQEGDRVWSEAWGFGEIIEEDGYNESVLFKSSPRSGAWITCEGSLATARTRPRTFFHAVADTDEGMREVIARGEGLKRPVPRGRWLIEPGDNVMMIEHDEIVFSEARDAGGSCFSIETSNNVYEKNGKSTEYSEFPMAMRLYDGEEPFEDPCENMRWMMDEAIKFGWHEKYGKR